MKERSYNLHDARSGAAITVRITSRSRRNEISEILEDGTIHIRLTAPQNAEKSNQALIAFLAEILQVNVSQLEIVAGNSGSDKLVTIIDLDKASVQDRIMAQLP